jgi:WD40 repeat protein
VSGAIARRAEALYEQQPPEGKAAARQLFLRLIAIGEGGIDDTRRRALRAELTSLEVDREAMEAVIDAFGTHRLLSFDRDPVSRGPTVEVAHEALLRQWTRLRGWIEAAREDVRMHRRLDASANEWARSGEDPSFLLRGARLGQFESWAAMTSVALSGPERRYLDAAMAHRDAEGAEEEARKAREATLERRSIVRLRAMIAILTIAALVASVLSVVAVGQRSNAQRVARAATARELAAAAVANLDVDAQRSVLLALQAVAATSEDGTVVPQALEALHGAVAADREVLTLRDPSTANVDWSPDGRLLVTGGTAGGVAQHDVVIWDARTGAKLRTLRGHTADIGYVAFAPDSDRVVSAADDGKAILWDVRTGKQIKWFTFRGEPMGGATFSPDGTRLAIATAGRARVVDASSGEVVRQWSAGDCGVPVFSPDGAHVAEGNGDHVTVWNVASGRTEFVRAMPDDSCAVVYSPDGRSLASTSAGAPVTILDARTGRPGLTFRAQPEVFGLDWSADGTRIATGGSDGTAKVWDAETGEEQLVLSGHAGLVALVAFSPDGTRLLTGGGDGTARVWDITAAGTAEAFGAVSPYEFTSVAYDPDGSSLLTTDQGPGRGGWQWDASTGAKIRGYPDAYNDVAIGGDPPMLALVGDGFRIADPATGRVVRTLSRDPDTLFSAAYSADGSRVALGNDAGTTRVWDTSSWRALGPFRGPLDQSEGWSDVALSPDGRLVASITGRAVLRVWDVDSGRRLHEVDAQTGFGRAVAFAPDGKALATAGGDGATVWSVPAGRRLATLAVTGRTTAVAFSRDGRHVVTGGADGTVRIWEAATGRLDLTLTGHTDAVSGVAFSPDGTRLATTGLDGTLRVYVLPVDELVRIAKARLTRGLTGSECRQYLHLPACPGGEAGGSKGAPSGTPTMPTRLGPEGTFRIEIGKSDLQAPGIDQDPEQLANSLGEYTLSLAHGTWRLHRERADGDRSDVVSTYTVAGRRITFELLDDTCYFGGTWSADWSVTATGLELTNIRSNVPAACDPANFQAVTSAVFGSRPLTRVT